MNKSLTRFLPIFSNGIRSVISPLISMIFAYLIINQFSKEIWGGFVEILLFILILTIISNWGNKDFLLREFSKNPKKIIQNWQRFFMSRLPILLLCFIVLFIKFDSQISLWLITWLFVSYIFQSFICVLIYNRDFWKTIFLELVSFVILIELIFYYKTAMNLYFLVKIYTIYSIIKAGLFSISYFNFLKFKSLKIDFSLLTLGSTFFFLAISGFLQSKVDVYVFQIFSDKITLGEYQIISGFFIFSQSMVMIFLLPYVKNIYRISSKSIKKIRTKISLLGLPLNAIAVFIIYLVLRQFYEIQLTTTQVIVGFFIGFPCYLYAIDIFMLFKKNKELEVIKISLISLFINLILSIVLLQNSYSITGVLIANAVANIISFSIYFLKREKTI